MSSIAAVVFVICLLCYILLKIFTAYADYVDSIMAIPVVQLPLLNLSTHPFDLLLAGIGVRMMQLARTNKPFQALLVDRNFVMQIASLDGIARNFTIANGQVTMASGHAAKADFTLRFRDGNQAIKILTQGKPAAFMVACKTVQCKWKVISVC